MVLKYTQKKAYAANVFLEDFIEFNENLEKKI